jgi:hypothetical protein
MLHADTDACVHAACTLHLHDACLPMNILGIHTSCTCTAYALPLLGANQFLRHGGEARARALRQLRQGGVRGRGAPPCADRHRVSACALLPTGFALRRDRYRRHWRRSDSIVPSAPVGSTVRSSQSSLPVFTAQAYFTALLTERTGVPAWSDAPSAVPELGSCASARVARRLLPSGSW